MQVKIKSKEMILEISLTETQLRLLYEGIGATSIVSRKKAGMTSDQAYCVDEFYYCISTAVQAFENS